MDSGKLTTFRNFVYEWRKPLGALIGFGAGIGISAMAWRFYSRRKLDKMEITCADEYSKKPDSNKVVILGLDDSCKSILLAALTNMPPPESRNFDGFHSVTTKPVYCGGRKTVQFIEVSGNSDSLQYWGKFTNTAALILVVVDVDNLSRLKLLTESLAPCIPEARRLGAKVYFVFTETASTLSALKASTEKILCLEGHIKNPADEIVKVTLRSGHIVAGIENVEAVIASNFK